MRRAWMTRACASRRFERCSRRQRGRYVAPYADFQMTILERVRLSDGNWAWIGQITKSGGAPPVGTILSVAMLLRYSLGLESEALAVEGAVNKAVESGARTADIAEKGRAALTTRQMGDAILAALD